MMNNGNREPTATRWIVEHSTSDGRYTIADNFVEEEAARAFADRQLAKGRIVRSIERDDAFRLDY